MKMYSLIVLFIAGLGVIITVILMNTHFSEPTWPTSVEHDDRLRAYLQQFPEYRVMLRMPDRRGDASAWMEVVRVDGDILTTRESVSIAWPEAGSVLIVYPNGDILYAHGDCFPPPDGCRFLTYDETNIRVTYPQLDEGNAYLRVTYNRTPIPQKGQQLYSTTLTNISAEPIRVVRFCPMEPGRDACVGGMVYTAEQFHAWYGMAEGQPWVEPGQSVSDDSNFGDPPILWAYFFETPSGKKMVAGNQLKRFP